MKNKDWEFIKDGIESFERVSDIRNIILLGEDGAIRNIENAWRYNEETK